MGLQVREPTNELTNERTNFNVSTLPFLGKFVKSVLEVTSNSHIENSSWKMLGN